MVELLPAMWWFTSARLTGMQGAWLGTDFSLFGGLVVKTCEEICFHSGWTTFALIKSLLMAGLRWNFLRLRSGDWWQILCEDSV